MSNTEAIQVVAQTGGDDAGLDPVLSSVGEDIRGLRKAKGLRLADVAKACGISIGYLSQMERGLSMPSIKVLHDISHVLGVQISWFFKGGGDAAAGERPFVVRRRNRRILTFGNGVSDYLLSPNLNGRIELLNCVFEPDASSGDGAYTHEGEEAGVVVSGTLELWVGEHRFLLEEGDSFTFSSEMPHRYRNASSTERAVVIWAITPPSY